MKTTIFELLRMIKDGNTPKKILFRGKCYRYVNKEKDYYLDGFSYDEALFDEYVLIDILNEEIEILETTIKYKTYHNDILHFTEIENLNDKIEKLNLTEVNGKILNTYATYIDKAMAKKINEIIDKVNKL